jgi:hypothetical protein
MSLYDHELPEGLQETATPWSRHDESASGAVQAEDALSQVPAESIAYPTGSTEHSPFKRRRVLTSTDSEARSAGASPVVTIRSPVSSFHNLHSRQITISSPDVPSGNAGFNIDLSRVESHASIGSGPPSNTAIELNESSHAQIGFSPSTELSWRPSPSQQTEISYATSPDTPGRLYLKRPIWPLKKLEEARLLRHYVEHLARSFDLTDPERYKS